MTPELQRAYDDECALEGRRIAQSEARRAPYRGALNGWAVPDAYEPRTPAQMLADAKGKLEARKAFEVSPEGQFVQHVADMQAQLVALSGQLEMARNARSRSWSGEIRTCEASMARAQVIARRLVELALDAEVECSLGALALEKGEGQ